MKRGRGRPRVIKGECSLEWCSRKEYARQLCVTHYERQRTGKPIVDPRIPKICAGPECNREVTTKGLCSTHYAQQYAGKEMTVIKAWRTETKGDRRKCRTCEQWKDYHDDFYDSSNGGKQGECKVCAVKRNSFHQERRKLAKKKLLQDA